MGSGISRFNLASCGPFHRMRAFHDNESDCNGPTKKLLKTNDDDHDYASAVSGDSEGQKCSSEKDVVKEEKRSEEKSTYFNDITNSQEEDEEDTGRISDYNGPFYMKSPSFRDFVRPIDRSDDFLKNGGKKEEEKTENKKTLAQSSDEHVCNDEVCWVQEKKMEKTVENKENAGKDKRIYKIFSHHYKPSSSGMKSLFHVHHLHNHRDPKSS